MDNAGKPRGLFSSSFMLLFVALMVVFSVGFALTCKNVLKPVVSTTLSVNVEEYQLSMYVMASCAGTFYSISSAPVVLLLGGEGLKLPTTDGSLVDCTASKPCLFAAITDEQGNLAVDYRALSLFWNVDKDAFKSAAVVGIIPYYDPNDFCNVKQALNIDSDSDWGRYANIKTAPTSFKDLPTFPADSLVYGHSLTEYKDKEKLPVAKMVDAAGNELEDFAPSSAVYGINPPPPPSSLSFQSTSSGGNELTWPLFMCASVFGLLLAAAYASGQDIFFWFTLTPTGKRGAMYTSAANVSQIKNLQVNKGAPLWMRWVSLGYTVGKSVLGAVLGWVEFGRQIGGGGKEKGKKGKAKPQAKKGKTGKKPGSPGSSGAGKKGGKVKLTKTAAKGGGKKEVAVAAPPSASSGSHFSFGEALDVAGGSHGGGFLGALIAGETVAEHPFKVITAFLGEKTRDALSNLERKGNNLSFSQRVAKAILKIFAWFMGVETVQDKIKKTQKEIDKKKKEAEKASGKVAAKLKVLIKELQHKLNIIKKRWQQGKLSVQQAQKKLAQLNSLISVLNLGENCGLNLANPAVARLVDRYLNYLQSGQSGKAKKAFNELLKAYAFAKALGNKIKALKGKLKDLQNQLKATLNNKRRAEVTKKIKLIQQQISVYTNLKGLILNGVAQGKTLSSIKKELSTQIGNLNQGAKRMRNAIKTLSKGKVQTQENLQKLAGLNEKLLQLKNQISYISSMQRAMNDTASNKLADALQKPFAHQVAVAGLSQAIGKASTSILYDLQMLQSKNLNKAQKQKLIQKIKSEWKNLSAMYGKREVEFKSFIQSSGGGAVLKSLGVSSKEISSMMPLAFAKGERQVYTALADALSSNKVLANALNAKDLKAAGAAVTASQAKAKLALLQNTEKQVNALLDKLSNAKDKTREELSSAQKNLQEAERQYYGLNKVINGQQAIEYFNTNIHTLQSQLESLRGEIKSGKLSEKEKAQKEKALAEKEKELSAMKEGLSNAEKLESEGIIDASPQIKSAVHELNQLSSEAKSLQGKLSYVNNQLAEVNRQLTQKGLKPAERLELQRKKARLEKDKEKYTAQSEELAKEFESSFGISVKGTPSEALTSLSGEANDELSISINNALSTSPTIDKIQDLHQDISSLSNKLNDYNHDLLQAARDGDIDEFKREMATTADKLNVLGKSVVSMLIGNMAELYINYLASKAGVGANKTFQEIAHEVNSFLQINPQFKLTDDAIRKYSNYISYAKHSSGESSFIQHYNKGNSTVHVSGKANVKLTGLSDEEVESNAVDAKTFGYSVKQDNNNIGVLLFKPSKGGKGEVIFKSADGKEHIIEKNLSKADFTRNKELYAVQAAVLSNPSLAKLPLTPEAVYHVNVPGQNAQILWDKDTGTVYANINGKIEVLQKGVKKFTAEKAKEATLLLLKSSAPKGLNIASLTPVVEKTNPSQVVALYDSSSGDYYSYKQGKLVKLSEADEEALDTKLENGLLASSLLTSSAVKTVGDTVATAEVNTFEQKGQTFYKIQNTITGEVDVYGMNGTVERFSNEEEFSNKFKDVSMSSPSTTGELIETEKGTAILVLSSTEKGGKATVLSLSNKGVEAVTRPILAVDSKTNPTGGVIITSEGDVIRGDMFQRVNDDTGEREYTLNADNASVVFNGDSFDVGGISAHEFEELHSTLGFDGANLTSFSGAGSFSFDSFGGPDVKGEINNQSVKVSSDAPAVYTQGSQLNSITIDMGSKGPEYNLSFLSWDGVSEAQFRVGKGEDYTDSVAAIQSAVIYQPSSGKIVVRDVDPSTGRIEEKAVSVNQYKHQLLSAYLGMKSAYENQEKIISDLSQTYLPEKPIEMLPSTPSQENLKAQKRQAEIARYRMANYEAKLGGVEYLEIAQKDPLISVNKQVDLSSNNPVVTSISTAYNSMNAIKEHTARLVQLESQKQSALSIEEQQKLGKEINQEKNYIKSYASALSYSYSALDAYSGKGVNDALHTIKRFSDDTKDILDSPDSLGGDTSFLGALHDSARRIGTLYKRAETFYSKENDLHIDKNKPLLKKFKRAVDIGEKLYQAHEEKYRVFVPAESETDKVSLTFYGLDTEKLQTVDMNGKKYFAIDPSEIPNSIKQKVKEVYNRYSDLESTISSNEIPFYPVLKKSLGRYSPISYDIALKPSPSVSQTHSETHEEEHIEQTEPTNPKSKDILYRKAKTNKGKKV